MYICPVLLYRCYLSVYSPFLLIVEVHWVACLMPVCGEVGLKPCASCVLTRMLWVFYKSRGEKKKTDNQMYKTCLVSNRPATSSSYTLGIITPKSLVTALVSLGLCEINTHKHTHKKKNLFDFSHQLTRHRLNLWHLSARTASFTMQNLLFNIRNDCLQCALYKKNDYFLSVYCILRLSLSTPVLNFPSRFLKPF